MSVLPAEKSKAPVAYARGSVKIVCSREKIGMCTGLADESVCLPHLDPQGVAIEWRRRFHLQADFSRLSKGAGAYARYTKDVWQLS